MHESAGLASSSAVSSTLQVVLVPRRREGLEQRELYGVDGLPFLVAVGVHDIFCSTDEIIDALYGGEAVVVATGASVRRRDGSSAWIENVQTGAAVPYRALRS